MIDAFSQLKIWSVFNIFDPRKLPQSITEISSYGNREKTVLIDHYGKEKATRINPLIKTRLRILMGKFQIQSAMWLYPVRLILRT